MIPSGVERKEKPLLGLSWFRYLAIRPCQNERLRWATFIRISKFYLLPLVLLRVKYPEIVHISCYEMSTSKLCAGPETLTSDTRIVKSAKEDDVVLP
jgi:hypothetical protein